MKPLTLYAFEKLSLKLDKLGFQKLALKGGFKLIKSVDVHKAYEKNQISFDNQGIYFTNEECKQSGYLFVKEYQVKRYGGLPKIHIAACEIVSPILKGRISDKFVWSNSRVNDVIDRDTGIEYPNRVLLICKKCKRLLNTKYNTSEDFYYSFDKSILQYQPRASTDIYGYHLRWKKISRWVREKNHYVCEHCHKKPRNEKEKQYWHVHHKDGNKYNNQEENLQCLCILCHSQVNERHKQNFSKGKQFEKLQTFIKIYPYL